jgi:hypothetical protein
MASQPYDSGSIRRTASFAKRMSTHIAYALVIYTLALIFEVSPQMEGEGMAIWPYFLLVALVGLAILPCRSLERRWQVIDANGSGNEGLFRRDVILLWLATIGLPTALMLVIWIIP